MARSFRNWVVQTSTTTGTGTYSLGDAPPGTSYFPFRQKFSDGESKIVYWVTNPTRTKWEKNRFGTLTFGTPDTLTRNVVESTNGDAPISWTGDDTPLRIYVAPDADAEEGIITQWLGAARHALIRFGMWWKDVTPSAGFQQLNIYDGTSDDPAGIMNSVAHKATLYGMPKGGLFGLTLSRSSATVLGIAAGECMDSTNVVGIYLAAFTKSTGGAWAAGSGGNGMGNGLTIANATWYHVFAILNAGLADVYIDTSVSAANKPTGTTHFRRIGSFRTDGSAQIIPFVQDGDNFQWTTMISSDVIANNPGTSAGSKTLTVPAGIRVKANIQLVLANVGGASGTTAYLSDLSTTDTTPTQGSNPIGDMPNTLTSSSGVSQSNARFEIWTNTSGQIRVRLSFSDANVGYTINTLGWIDRRGKDA